MRSFYLPVVVATCLLSASLASSPSGAADEKATLTEASLPVVTVTTVSRSTIVASVPVSGTLVAREEVLINPQVSGYEIESLAADVGDRVAAGAVMAVLNKQVLMAQVAQADADMARVAASVEQAKSQIVSAEASLTQTQATLERSQALRKSGTLSQSVLDQAIAAADSATSAVASAKSGLAVAVAQQNQAKVGLDLAKLNLERADIVAPVGGVIAERKAQVGAIANATGGPLFRIIREGEIEIDAEVIETQLASVSVGDGATVNVAGIGEMHGVVRMISPTVDPVTRLGNIRISLVGGSKLRIGLFASGTVISDIREALVLPVGAVLWDPQGSFVQVVANGAVERRPVTGGLVSKGMREIVAGLSEGEQVLARAGAFFRDGDKVQVKSATGQQTGKNSQVAEPVK